ncbi:MAG TPA: MFS transporter [Nocardioidaceae bacterium]|nr:MFS transporter [Nocardioidaceae bacterium]
MTTTDIAREATGPQENGQDSGEAGHSRLGWALVLISVAQLMVVLDSTIANIALPFIGNDLSIGQSNLQWIITGYALAFGGLLLLGGRLGDLYGRRRVFIVGVVLFAVASAFGGLAQNEAMLLVARALQGVGAAIASPAALALITTTFPAGPQRNRAFSVYAAMSGAGAAVGLILGGWLTGLEPTLLGFDVEGWRLTFLIVVPFGLGAALLAPRLLPESERNPSTLDLPGALTGTLGLTSLVYGFSRAGDQNHGWDDPWTLVWLAFGVGLLAAFIAIERRVDNPLMPFRILANRTRATSFVVMMIVPAAMFSMFFFLSQYVQGVIGFSPLETGFAFLPFSFGIVISATIASKLMSHVDPRWLAGLGTAMAGTALFGFSQLPLDATLPGLSTDASYATDILPFIVLMSLGMGLVFVPMTLTAVHGVDAKDSGIGSGVLNAMQQIGGALGLAILSTVAVGSMNDKAAEIGAGVQRLGQGAGLPADPSGLIGDVVFTQGSIEAFAVGSAMIFVASAIALVLLNVRHKELATDGPEAPVHVG